MPQHLCLDFGTGYCKAAICSPGNPPSPLAIGRAARQQRGDPHMVRTALHVSQAGRLHFGEAAVDAAGSEDERPFDRIKEALTNAKHDGDLDVPLPTESTLSGYAVTQRQAIALYLAFLTQAALRCPQVPDRHVVRSIAMPVFDAPKTQWAEATLHASLGDAHALADHFGDALFEGIDLKEAIRALNSKPPHLSQIIAQPATIAEPVAAAAAQLLHITPDGDGAPGLLIVIDVGAGTTDIAMFAKGQVSGRVALPHVAGSKRSIPKAGKAIDQALIEHLVGKSPAGQRERMRVQLQREAGGEPIKEELLRERRVTRSGIATSFEDFSASTEMGSVIVAIRHGFNEMLETVDPSFFRHRMAAVRLSGGGASWPFVPKLARDRWVGEDGKLKTRAKMSQAMTEPGWFNVPRYDALQREVDGKFNRLAVALGGAYYGADAHSWLRLGEDISAL